MNTITKHDNPRVNAYLIADESWAAHASDLWKNSHDFSYTVLCSELYTARCEAEAQLTVVERHMATRAATQLDALLASYGDARQYYEGLSEDYYMNFDNKPYVTHFAEASAELHLASLPLLELGFTHTDLDRLYHYVLGDVGATIASRYNMHRELG